MEEIAPYDDLPVLLDKLAHDLVCLYLINRNRPQADSERVIAVYLAKQLHLVEIRNATLRAIQLLTELESSEAAEARHKLRNLSAVLM